MSRTLSLISPAGQYASPNQLVTAQIATNVGFNANDYVYAYGNNQVGSLGATIGLGAVSTFVAGTRVNGAAASGFSPTSVMSGPYSATGTYTGTTRTIGGIFQATTNVSTQNANGAKQCILNNGNLAILFLDNDNAYLYMTVVTQAGVTIKAATFVSGQGSLGMATASISAMADGGFIIVFSNSSDCRYARYDSLGNTLVSQTVLQGTFASPQSYLNAVGTKGGGWMVIGHGGGSQVYVQSYSPTNSYLGQISVASATSGYYGNIVALSDGNCAISWSQGSSSLIYAIISPSLVEVKPYTFLHSTGNFTSMAAYDGGFVLSTPSGNTGEVTTSSVSNSGTTLKSDLRTGVMPSGAAGQINICISSENNVANLMIRASGGTWVLAKLTSINSTAMALGTQTTLSTYSLTYASANNTFVNALNGSLCHVSLNSNKPAITSFNQDTYTQNTTVLTNQGLYTPPNGYYFLGIAATTAAANGSGLVYTNGGIALPSTYPSVTTGYAFDYQSNSYWAQRGTINGRAINLQGAQ